MLLLTRLFSTQQDRDRFPEVFSTPTLSVALPKVEAAKACSVRVLILGMPRTGTTSLYKALAQIGITPSYHMVDWLKTPHDMSRWAHAVKVKYGASLPSCVEGLPNVTHLPDMPQPDDVSMLHTRRYWDPVFHAYTVVIDVPGAAFMPELVQAYPEAKVVIVEREAEKWLQSYMDTVHNFIADTATSRVMMWLAGDVRRQELRKTLQIMVTCLFDGKPPSDKTAKDREQTLTRYHRIHQELRDVVPRERRLEWKFSDGWSPLCAFLGVKEVPTTHFPHVNDTAAFQRRLTLMRLRTMDAILTRWLPRFGVSLAVVYAMKMYL